MCITTPITTVVSPKCSQKSLNVYTIIVILYKVLFSLNPSDFKNFNVDKLTILAK